MPRKVRAEPQAKNHVGDHRDDNEFRRDLDPKKTSVGRRE